MSLSEQEIIRREKLQKLTDLGIDAFPAAEYKITDSTKSIKQNFEEGKKVVIAGRLMSRRIQERQVLQNCRILKENSGLF
jgi:lysyl-tRNA synthetase class 2